MYVGRNREHHNLELLRDMELLTVGYFYNFEKTTIASIYKFQDGFLNVKFLEYKKLDVKDAILQISVFREKMSKNQITVLENEIIKSQIGRTINLIGEKNLQDYLAIFESLKISNRLNVENITSHNQKTAMLLSLVGLNLSIIFKDDRSENLCVGTVMARPSYFGRKTGYVSIRSKKRNFGRFLS